MTDHPLLPASNVPSLLIAHDIRKSFAGVEVLKGVTFEVRPGEVHALCGENGAGKSTLTNILAGVLPPDSGTIHFDGHDYIRFENAHAAQKLGIATVFQERSLFAPLTVAENIFAGRQPTNRLGKIQREKMGASAAALLARVAPEIHPGRFVETLSPAQQQMVEIAKALSLDSRVLIFDEPTAALTGSETRRLFEAIRELQAQGRSIIYISHRLEEIFLLADRVTVLKDGAWQGTVAVAETNHGDLIRRMVGRNLEAPHQNPPDATGPVQLEIRDLSDASHQRGRVRLRGVSLQVRSGEIVGLAGLAGSGRTELALSVFGARGPVSGDVLIGGRDARIRSPQQAIAAGLGYVSEDRKELGLFLEMPIAANVAAANLGRFGAIFFNDRLQNRVAESYRRSLRIVSHGVGQEVLRLSGGNQQKVLLARWLLVNPKVLIVDEPTRGVDVGAKSEVHELLYHFTRKGGAVLMISSDLPEILTVSDRIVVMHNGRVQGELAKAEATEQAVMRLATAGGAN